MIYHIISRTTLNGYVIEDEDKDFFVGLLRHLSQVYFVEILGYTIMGNHFHVVVKMKIGETVTDEQIAQRFAIYYPKEGKDPQRQFSEGQIPYFRDKWGNLSEYVKDLKQRFTRYYNKKQGKKGYFWSDRFKSVIVEEGDTLINCLAYIELNACRAGLVKRPEEYRWCSLG